MILIEWLFEIIISNAELWSIIVVVVLTANGIIPLNQVSSNSGYSEDNKWINKQNKKILFVLSLAYFILTIFTKIYTGCEPIQLIYCRYNPGSLWCPVRPVSLPTVPAPAPSESISVPDPASTPEPSLQPDSGSTPVIAPEPSTDSVTSSSAPKIPSSKNSNYEIGVRDVLSAQNSTQSQPQASCGAPILAKPIGDTNNWINEEDYPAESLLNNETGTTHYILLINGGKVINCSIKISSGFKNLDDFTCKILTKRAIFYNTPICNGEYLTGYYENRVVWKIKD